MYILYIVIVTWCTLLELACGDQLPLDIEKCHFGHSECIANSINNLIRKYPKGIPDIGLRPLDVVPTIDLTILEKPINHVPCWISFKLRNNTLKGFNNATIYDVSGFERDPTKSKIQIKALIPSLIQESIYDMEGALIVFKANTTGKLRSDFQNFSMTLTLKGFMEYRDNKRYFKIYSLEPTIALDRWIFWLDDLYKENTDLTVVLNNALNEGWLEFWNEIEPGVMDMFTLRLTDIFNEVFATLSYDDMFLTDKN